VGILTRLQLNISDAMALGPQILMRHLSRLTGASTSCVKIAGHGHIHLRRGETDIYVIRQVFKDKQYALFSRLGTRAMLRYAEIVKFGKKPVIVDAGANVGAASVWFKNTYPASHIVAVEPEPGNVSVLRKNRRDGISIIEAAMGSAPGFAVLKNEEKGGWAIQTQRAGQGVPIVTMAEAFASVENGLPFIAKIDIEGFESDLFAQNLDWLDEVFLLYIEPHDWLMPGEMTSRTFQRAMGERDFEILLAGENLIYVRR
jgi:FkbM family methyltransferase